MGWFKKKKVASESLIETIATIKLSLYYPIYTTLWNVLSNRSFWFFCYLFRQQHLLYFSLYHFTPLLHTKLTNQTLAINLKLFSSLFMVNWKLFWSYQILLDLSNLRTLKYVRFTHNIYSKVHLIFPNIVLQAVL